jgi:hypothetical protein
MGRFFLRIWRWLRAEIVFGFMIGSVFWTAVLGWQAAYAPTDAEKQKCYDAAHNAGHKSEECKALWEKTTSDPVAFFTLVLAISTIGLWVATVFLYRAGERQFGHARRSAAIQSRDMQDSISVSKAANQLSREIFAAGKRPWLKVHVQLASGFRYNPVNQAGIVDLTITVKNLGDVPALNVHGMTGTHPNTLGKSDTEAFKSFCELGWAGPIRRPGYGSVQYPNDPPLVIDHGWATASWYQNNIDIGVANGGKGDDPLAVMVCVNYAGVVGEAPYQTAFLFYLVRRTSDGWSSFLISNGDIPMDDLILIPHPVGTRIT